MFTTYDNGRKKYALLLKADEFLRDRSILAAARAYPGMIVGMSMTPAVPPNRYFDHVLAGDPHQPASALEAVKRFEEERGMTPEAVIPITEMTMHSALEIAEAYKLPFLSRSSVNASRDKHLMKAAFNAKGVSTPRHELFSDLASLRQAIEKLGFPVIVKPCAAAHSIGIIRIDDEAHVADAFQHCSSGLSGVSESWRIDNQLFQVEEYIDARREVSVEVVNQGDQRAVIAVTEKFLTPPPFFAEIGHMIPSPDNDNEALKGLALAACSALGLRHGVAHVEVRIDDKGRMFVIEVAARPGGDGIMDLVERSCGVNMYDLHVRSYLGKLDAVPRDVKIKGTAAIAFMQTKRGTVTGVNVPRELPREVVSLYITARKGTILGGSLNYDDRAGTVEFFWPDQLTYPGPRHLELAHQLAEQIFTIS
jgi:biotin carboxylase